MMKKSLTCLLQAVRENFFKSKIKEGGDKEGQPKSFTLWLCKSGYKVKQVKLSG